MLLNRQLWQRHIRKSCGLRFKSSGKQRQAIPELEPSLAELLLATGEQKKGNKQPWKLSEAMKTTRLNALRDNPTGNKKRLLLRRQNEDAPHWSMKVAMKKGRASSEQYLRPRFIAGTKTESDKERPSKSRRRAKSGKTQEEEETAVESAERGERGMNMPRLPDASQDIKSNLIEGLSTTLRSDHLAFHWETTPSSENERSFASHFFLAHPPSKLFTAGKIHQAPMISIPEVAFFGRSNVGKSTLLNAILGAELCFTSKHPGRTRTMNAYAVGGPDGGGNSGRLTIVDMPGYGKGSHAEWGKEIEKYLLQRKELKRAFVLIDAMHGLKETDRIFLRMLRHNSIPHQIIASKADRLLQLASAKHAKPELMLQQGMKALNKAVDRLKQDIQPKDDGPPALGEILCTAANTGQRSQYTSEGKIMGVDAIRWAILRATGLSALASKSKPIVVNVLPKHL